MKAFAFYRRYWAAIGGLVFVGLTFGLGIWGEQIPMLQRLAILLYMSLLFHQFEEYVFPGGFAVTNNIALFGEKQDVTKYPLNEMSAMAVNVVCAYPLYIVGIFLYKYQWYDIFLAYFSMSQVLMHGVKMNRALHSWYCPGFLSAVCVMLPLSIYMLWYIATNYELPHYYWWAPLAAFPVIAVLTILVPILIFRSRETPYAFPQYQADEFAVKHGIASLWRKDK